MLCWKVIRQGPGTVFSANKQPFPVPVHNLQSIRRLLGLEPEVQTCIFDFYQAILDSTIAQARREGRYDDGIVDVAGTAISLAEAPKVRLSGLPGHGQEWLRMAYCVGQDVQGHEENSNSR